MKVSLLSNVNVQILATQLSSSWDLYYPPGYNTWQTEVLNPTSGLHGFQPDIVLFLLDGSSLFEEFSGQSSSDAFSLIQTYAELNPSIKVVINTIDVIQEIPLSLHSLSKEKQFEYQHTPWVYSL